MKTTLVFLIMATSTGVAGPFSVGIKAGVPLTDFLNSVNSGTPANLVYNSNTNRYIFGGTAEVHLPAGFGIEFDALYRHFNYTSHSSLVDVITNNRATGNAWEFPILVKYRFPTPLVKPFLDAGITFDTLSGLKQELTTIVAPNRVTTSSTGNPAELHNSTTAGVVLGVGLDIHAVVVHISPEIRYTRWGSAHFKIPNGSLLSDQNQAEFLIGFTF